MLPHTEDDGLARLAVEGRLSIDTILLNSAVCGTGLDTVPIPGTASELEIAALFCDVASMAGRLQKPLSCRIWPVQNKVAGDAVRFDCPFFVDSTVLALGPGEPSHQRSRAAWAMAGLVVACAATAGWALGRAASRR